MCIKNKFGILIYIIPSFMALHKAKLFFLICFTISVEKNTSFLVQVAHRFG